MASQRSVILFAPNLIPLIKNGTKTLTYRLDDDKLDFLDIGDRIEAEDSSTGEAFAELEITAKHYTTFGQLPIGRQGNVTYRSKNDQRRVFKGYYRRDVEDTERVLVLGFKDISWLDDKR